LQHFTLPALFLAADSQAEDKKLYYTFLFEIFAIMADFSNAKIHNIS